MKQIKINDGQSIIDIAIQEYGSVERGLFKILIDNSILDLDSKLSFGDLINIDDFLPITTNTRFFKSNNIFINNQDNLIDAELVLTVRIESIGNEINGSDGFINIIVTGGIKPYNYEWYNSDNAVISNQQNLTGVNSGQYSLIVTDDNDDSVSITALIISVANDDIYLVDNNGNLILDSDNQPIKVS